MYFKKKKKYTNTYTKEDSMTHVEWRYLCGCVRTMNQFFKTALQLKNPMGAFFVAEQVHTDVEVRVGVVGSKRVRVVLPVLIYRLYGTNIN